MPREVTTHPWRKTAVDFIGLWTLRIDNMEIPFCALSIIDMATNLIELVQVNDKTSEHVTMHFENMWSSRCPLPKDCICDQGGEFVGFPFQRLFRQNGIKGHPILAKNP